MLDCVVIGKGPAGISAALYCKRAALDVVVVGRDGGALTKAEKIENYYGVENAPSGKELLQSGWKQAEGLGIPVLDDEIVELEWDGAFTVTGKAKQWRAESVVLATGASRMAPPIPGLKELEGAGVSYCAVCDAFFFRGKDVAVLGAGEYALHEANVLLPLARSVSVFWNGKPAEAVFPEPMRVYPEKIATLEGDGRLERVKLVTGKEISMDGFFVALGTAAAGDFARKLGAEIVGGRAAVDAAQATSVPGLFAAGDCTGGLLQVAKAVHEGAQAGLSAVAFVREQKKLRG